MPTENLSIKDQTLESMINRESSHEDKTDLVYRLVTSQDYYFLCQPARPGKSLPRAVNEYFAGNKEYFNGLKIASLEKDWKKYPVLRFDLNGVDFKESEGVPIYLSSLIEDYENEYPSTKCYTYCNGYKDFVIRFRRLIKSAYEETGREVVILIEDCEKPLIVTSDNPDLQNRHLGYLKPFYSILKTMEEYIRFVLFTGVTPMDQLEVLSDLNSLSDLSCNNEFAAIKCL